MLIAGSDDGLYRLAASDGASADRVLDAGEVMRVRSPPGVDGLVAATGTGLYHSPDGEAWTDLGVPREAVYAVAGTPDGRLYAGTRPAAVYVATVDDGISGALEWRELSGFQDLPSRDSWRLPRHEDLAQVRDLHVPRDAPDRVVAGVEVGGVHVSDDAGETWTERRDGVDDDVHELLVRGPDDYVAATGFGLFRTTDGGRSWTRLDEGHDQRYFRSAAAVDGTVYAGGALAHTATWDDDDAAPALFAWRGGDGIERVPHPRPAETVTGLAGVDGALVAATHRGTVMLRRGDEWSVAGALPVASDHAVSYTPLAAVDA